MSGLFIFWFCTYCPPPLTFMPFLCQLVHIQFAKIRQKNLHLLTSRKANIYWVLSCIPGFTYIVPFDLQNSHLWAYTSICIIDENMRLRGEGDRGGWQRSIWTHGSHSKASAPHCYGTHLILHPPKQHLNYRPQLCIHDWNTIYLFCISKYCLLR